jgi:hypothetical protein
MFVEKRLTNAAVLVRKFTTVVKNVKSTTGNTIKAIVYLKLRMKRIHLILVYSTNLIYGTTNGSKLLRNIGRRLLHRLVRVSI